MQETKLVIVLLECLWSRSQNIDVHVFWANMMIVSSLSLNLR